MVKDLNWFQRAIRFAESPFQPKPKQLEVVEPRQVTEVRKITIQSQPVGATGTKSYGGYPNEEYFNTLRGRKKADVFDQMRRSDPQLIMCSRAVKNPIKSAVWRMEPADDSDQAKKDAEFCEDMILKGMPGGWSRKVNEMLTCIEFGHSVFEITHELIQNHAKYGTIYGIGDLGWRSPRTIERWNLDPSDGCLESIDQYVYGDLQRLVRIDEEFLMIITMDMEGSNYEGISYYRPCYGSWFRKDNYMKLNGIGIEKFAIPTPIFKIPSGMQGDESFSELEDVAQAYATHEKAFMIINSEVEVDFNTNTYDPAKVEASIDAEDRRMVKAFLANFLELGMGQSGGAYALSNDLSDFFLAGIEHIVSTIEEAVNCKLIPQLVQMNFGERDAYPKLKHSGISDKAGRELAEVLKSLADSRIIIPDNVLEADIRKRFNLPVISADGQRQPQASPAANINSSAPPNPPKTMQERIRLMEALRSGNGRS